VRASLGEPGAPLRVAEEVAAALGPPAAPGVTGT